MQVNHLSLMGGMMIGEKLALQNALYSVYDYAKLNQSTGSGTFKGPIKVFKIK